MTYSQKKCNAEKKRKNTTINKAGIVVYSNFNTMRKSPGRRL